MTDALLTWHKSGKNVHSKYHTGMMIDMQKADLTVFLTKYYKYLYVSDNA